MFSCLRFVFRQNPYCGPDYTKLYAHTVFSQTGRQAGSSYCKVDHPVVCLFDVSGFTTKARRTNEVLARRYTLQKNGILFVGGESGDVTCWPEF